MDRMLTKFESGFLASALWTSTTDEENFDEFTIYDFTEDAYSKLLGYAHKFYQDNAMIINQAKELADIDDEEIGHCLWLSSNGHGGGFFDYSGECFDTLQKNARYHEMNLFVNDENIIDVM